MHKVHLTDDKNVTHVDDVAVHIPQYFKLNQLLNSSFIVYKLRKISGEGQGKIEERCGEALGGERRSERNPGLIYICLTGLLNTGFSTF